MGDQIPGHADSVPSEPSTSSQLRGSTRGPLALGGAMSVGAGAIHAAAIGAHSEHRQAVYAFTAAAVFQLGWGAVALVRSTKLVAIIGAVGHIALLAGWIYAKTTGIPFVDGLTEAEGVQFADALAAGLAASAALIALSAALTPIERSGRVTVNAGVAALVVAALAVPAMVSTGGHSHGEVHDHGDDAAADDDGRVHETDHLHDTDELAPDVDESGGSASSAHAHEGESAAATSGPQETTTAEGVLHEHGEAIAITAGELDAANRLVADTRAAAERFEDLEAAKAQGFYQVAPPRNGLVHYMNAAYNRDGLILDPEHPESLIYLNLSDGSWKLVGVMYRMPSPDEPGPRVGGPLTGWHAHDNLCRAEGRVVAVAVDGACSQGSLSTTPEMLHVWLVDNPDGVFADDMEPSGLLEVVEGTAAG